MDRSLSVGDDDGADVESPPEVLLPTPEVEGSREREILEAPVGVPERDVVFDIQVGSAAERREQRVDGVLEVARDGVDPKLHQGGGEAVQGSDFGEVLGVDADEDRGDAFVEDPACPDPIRDPVQDACGGGRQAAGVDRAGCLRRRG